VDCDFFPSTNLKSAERRAKTILSSSTAMNQSGRYFNRVRVFQNLENIKSIKDLADQVLNLRYGQVLRDKVRINAQAQHCLRVA
jgi:hypothetical protein